MGADILKSVYIVLGALGNFPEHQPAVSVTGQMPSFHIRRGALGNLHHEWKFVLDKITQQRGINGGAKVVGIGDKRIIDSFIQELLENTGNVKRRVDIAVPGRVPFKAESTAALIHKVVYEAPPPLRSVRPDLPQAVQQVLSRVLSKDAEARYTSSLELVRALEQAIVGATAVERNSARPTKATRPAGARATRTPPPSRVSASGVGPTGKRSIPTVVWALGGGALALFLLMAVIVGVIIVAGSGGDDTLAASPPKATSVVLGVGVDEGTETPSAELPPTEMPAPTEEPILVEEATPVDAPNPTLPPEPTGVPTSMPEAMATSVPPPTYEPTASPPPTPTQEPTATQPAGNRATITDVQVSGDRYAVYFDVYSFQPVLPGLHLHFFFDTVPPDQAGLPGGGPWLIYPSSSGGTAYSPFTGYGVGDRPAAASQMCVLVANGDHSVQPNTGNCYYLP